MERVWRAASASIGLAALVFGGCSRPGPVTQVPVSSPTPLPTSQIRPDDRIGLAWARIPAGSYAMGCVPQDPGCAGDEKPSRRQTVSAFWMNVTDVTVAAFTRCVEAGGCTAAAAKGEACNYGRRPDHPVNCVDWSQARAFCVWAGGRLPTAAEWEYAAKSGRDVIYPWGDTAPDSSRATFDDGTVRKGTDPAGKHPAGDTPWGLKDMAGNVWQWTDTHYDGQNIEMRGGSWVVDDLPFLRASVRIKNRPGNGLDAIGFRCVQ
jgi:formylglycine-generating enzyme required for sulfatase activity